MSDSTNDAIREDYGNDVELPTKENSLVLWHYASVLRVLKEAKRDLHKDSYKDLVDTLESELQRRAALSKAPYTLGDIVRERNRTAHEDRATRWLNEAETVAQAVNDCQDGLLPDGDRCPNCGGFRAPSGIDGGTWVHAPHLDPNRSEEIG